MNHRFASRRSAAVASVVAALVCAGSGDRPPICRSEPATSTRLLEALGPDSLTGDGMASWSSLAGEPDASDWLVRESFDGAPNVGVGTPSTKNPDAPMPTAEWWSFLGLMASERNAPATSQSGLSLVRDADGTSAVAIGPPSHAMVRDLALDGREWALVRARVRSTAAHAGSASLSVERLEKLTSPLGPQGLLNRALRPSTARRRLTDLTVAIGGDAAGAPADTWRVIEIRVPPMERRQGQGQGLRVRLDIEGATVLVDWIEVRRLTSTAILASAPRAAGDASRLPWRRLVRWGGEFGDALLLVGATKATIPIEVPARAPRMAFRLSTTDLPSHGGRELIVRIDGQIVRRVGPGAAALGTQRCFVPVTVPLAALAGRHVTLELEATGDVDGALLVMAPELLGTPADALMSTRPNLVLISIDTLRADHVGCYGSARGLTPRIDELAARGTLFSQMRAIASWTLPSHTSMLSGQHPLVHAADRDDRCVDLHRSTLLAQEARAAGWSTCAFTGGLFLDPSYGLAAGFDTYSTEDPGIHAADRLAVHGDPMTAPIAWLESHSDQPFVLFLHTYAVHNYTPLPSELVRLSSGETPPTTDQRLKLYAELCCGERSHLERFQRLYAAALHQVDERVVGRVIDELAARDLSARTIVAVISDHGEQWFEHGGCGHGRLLWQELVRVPWIVAGPGIASGVRSDVPTFHEDVTPTLLRRLGQVPPERMTGVDALGDSTAFEDRPRLLCVKSRGDLIYALVASRWKLIRVHDGRTGAEQLQLFDLEADPGEKFDLTAREPAQTSVLERRLDAEIVRRREQAQAIGSAEPSPVERTATLDAELRALGYLQADH